MATVNAGGGAGEPVTYRHPVSGDTWTLHPDSAGDVVLDARVVGLMLEAAGYRRMGHWLEDPLMDDQPGGIGDGW